MGFINFFKNLYRGAVLKVNDFKEKKQSPNFIEQKSFNNIVLETFGKKYYQTFYKNKINSINQITNPSKFLKIKPLKTILYESGKSFNNFELPRDYNTLTFRSGIFNDSISLRQGAPGYSQKDILEKAISDSQNYRSDSFILLKGLNEKIKVISSTKSDDLGGITLLNKTEYVSDARSEFRIKFESLEEQVKGELKKLSQKDYLKNDHETGKEINFSDERINDATIQLMKEVYSGNLFVNPLRRMRNEYKNDVLHLENQLNRVSHKISERVYSILNNTGIDDKLKAIEGDNLLKSEKSKKVFKRKIEVARENSDEKIVDYKGFVEEYLLRKERLEIFEKKYFNEEKSLKSKIDKLIKNGIYANEVDSNEFDDMKIKLENYSKGNNKYATLQNIKLSLISEYKSLMGDVGNFADPKLMKKKVRKLNDNDLETMFTSVVEAYDINGKKGFKNQNSANNFFELYKLKSAVDQIKQSGFKNIKDKIMYKLNLVK